MWYEEVRKRGEECGMRERGRGGSVVQESEEDEEGVWYKSEEEEEGVWYKIEEGIELRVDERRVCESEKGVKGENVEEGMREAAA